MLLDHGHPLAWHYPIGRVWDEASLIVERLNGMALTQAILIQKAVSSLLSKEGAKDFTDTIKRLTPDGY